MSRSFRDADLAALTEGYNAFAPARYRIDADLLRFNTVESSLFDWGASGIASDGGTFLVIKRAAFGRMYRGPDKDQMHLCLISCAEPMAGLELMDEAKRILRDRGATRLVFGQDSRHFFPGCPTDFPALRDFLTIQGFGEGGESHDLERDLDDYSSPFPRIAGSEYRLVEESDLPTLWSFFDREFPDRWKYDVFEKIRNEGGPSCVFGLFLDKRLEGFALLQDSECKAPIGGAVWRADLGERWGSLGPIGVSKTIRGRGHGNALLGAALEHLRDRGVRRCIIDWTGLVDFYGGHGFQVTRTYRSMALPLEGAAPSVEL